MRWKNQRSKRAGKVGNNDQSEGFLNGQCVSSSLGWLLTWSPGWLTQSQSHRRTRQHLPEEEAPFLPMCFKSKAIFPRRPAAPSSGLRGQKLHHIPTPPTQISSMGKG